ncbi:epimerase [Thalassococcus sp. BH17M4-6]|uniref:epimerase n=1 Tax=Thalassococcus sp. BH17M4-6 TaxID=3413148 RepID=UPI003BE7B5E5
MTGTVLILGSSGRFGRHVAEVFWNRGWRLRMFDRATDDLALAARGADVIVNGWNPPYDRWQAEVPTLTRAVIDAAQASGATVLIPGNVYVYGATAPEVLGAATPHRADNPLGRIRREMESAYRSAGLRTIVLRAGDFIDNQVSGNWFDRVIAAGVARGGFSYPGPLDVPHAWAWLPDLAEAAEHLARHRSTLPTFADVPFQGYTLTGRDLHRAAEAALGRGLTLRQMSWLPLQLASPVWPLARHLREMRYLWSMPHRLAAAEVLRSLPVTPVEEALSQALAPLAQVLAPDKLRVAA